MDQQLLAERPTPQPGVARAAFGERLREFGLAPVFRGVWAVVGASDRAFGWKLHLSSTPHQADELLDAIVPLLARRLTPFKIARDAELLAMLNEGALGETQVGKFATLYPADDDDAVDLAHALVAATKGHAGPRIITDLHLGSVVYARYGPFSPPMTRDRLGFYVAEDDDGAAAYRVPFSLPDGLRNPFEAGFPRQEPARAEVRPIGGYLIVEPLQAGAKGAVLKAVDLRSQDRVGLVVLKEGRPYCLCDQEGRDMRDRLRNQAEAHRALAGRAPVPAADAMFEHDESLYLPLAFVDGRDFGSWRATPFHRHTAADQKALLEQLLAVTASLGKMHDAGYVHRDLSMRNIRITPEGRAVLIDLEISDPLGNDSRPFTQGTAGFVSPQQLANHPPAASDDVFALGSVIICAITGLDPQRVLYARHPERSNQLRALSGAPEALTDLAAACVDEDPARRPTVAAIAAALENCLEHPMPPPRPQPAPDYRQIASAGLTWLVRGAMRDDTSGMWRSPDLEAGNHGSLKLVNAYRVYRNANRGVAGIVYLLAKLQRFGLAAEGAKAAVEAAVDWLLWHEPTPDDQMPGLHFGEAGVAVAIAEAVACGMIEPGPWLDPYVAEALSGPLDWPDLTHGAAGQGLAAFTVSDLLQAPKLAGYADRCADFLGERQEADGSWRLPEGVRTMSGRTFTGYAHGVAGIASFLAVHARRTGSLETAAAAERAAEWLLAQARSAGTSLWWPMQTDDSASWSWWCHGGPGIALAFLDMFELAGDKRYAAAVRAALRSHPLEARHANMSQCHGLSGLGEILLEAYRLLPEPEWLERANAIAVTLANLARCTDDGASWLVENPYQPTPDLMIGCGGVVHFLARMGLGSPASFRFPLNPHGSGGVS